MYDVLIKLVDNYSKQTKTYKASDLIGAIPDKNEQEKVKVLLETKDGAKLLTKKFINEMKSLVSKQYRVTDYRIINANDHRIELADYVDLDRINATYKEAELSNENPKES